MTDWTTDPGPQVYDHISEANDEGFADAADGEALFPDADPDYAAGWHAFHRQREAAAEVLRDLTEAGRLEHYRKMPGLYAYHQIADDFRRGLLTEDEAISYCDTIFPPISNKAADGAAS